MRFHILGIPHTVSTPEYSTCAFTQKVVKLCKMLTASGHHVIHYGHVDSAVECTEHVTITDDLILRSSYGDHDWRTRGWPEFSVTDTAYTVFYAAAIRAIKERKQPGDFLLCPFGSGHQPVAEANQDMIICEPGIGYPSGTFAPFRIFESYAIMHAYHGQKAIESASNDFWYDAVIPNYFDLDEFTFSRDKSSYLLFLGRVNVGKGIHVATQLANKMRIPLVVAGQGNVEETDYVKSFGIANPQQRSVLLSHARAVLCPSTFLEPFCGVQIEAMLSGTPVISSDWGAFAEYNRHGETGFRCKTFEQFMWAINHIDQIDPTNCRAWAERFSLDRIAPMFTDYFESISKTTGNGKGWYAERPDRETIMTASW